MQTGWAKYDVRGERKGKKVGESKSFTKHFHKMFKIQNFVEK